jgi:hypothetical protein
MLQTVWGSLFKSLRLGAGERLLVRGGTTSVGLAAAAIAKKPRGDRRIDYPQARPRTAATVERRGPGIHRYRDDRAAGEGGFPGRGRQGARTHRHNDTQRLAALRQASRYCMTGMVGGNNRGKRDSNRRSLSKDTWVPFKEG